ncbi:hypothetical protein JZ751_009378 [Albula glossodonta]|uniref:Septin-type G domain-containing protein n=1 Tax=Albula glossodonta TaxID=121402 RepID=A0A8T2MMY7_9TELE|nr:hypothetical protein JZ751_009378 [Albula glossodonta]
MLPLLIATGLWGTPERPFPPTDPALDPLQNATRALLHAAQQKNLEGYVGFANLPNQVYRKSVKRGFEFTLMVVDLYSAEYPGPSHRIKKTVQIMREIQEHKIKIYEFPQTDDEEENKLVKKIKDRLPLAVVGSNTIIEVNGKRVRGRQYPWGVAEGEEEGDREGCQMENAEHCDFTILRDMLIRTHMQDLKDVTNNVHYENYRSRKLAAVTCNGIDNNKTKGQLTKIDAVEGMSPLAQMEEERREHVAKMKKMEMEMEQVFEMKVKEKIQKLKDSEGELQRRHEQMKKSLEAQHKELEEKRRQFEEEKVNWEAQQRLLEQQKPDSRTLEKNKRKKIFS